MYFIRKIASGNEHRCIARCKCTGSLIISLKSSKYFILQILHGNLIHDPANHNCKRCHKWNLFVIENTRIFVKRSKSIHLKTCRLHNNAVYVRISILDGTFKISLPHKRGITKSLVQNSPNTFAKLLWCKVFSFSLLVLKSVVVQQIFHDCLFNEVYTQAALKLWKVEFCTFSMGRIRTMIIIILFSS